MDSQSGLVFASFLAASSLVGLVYAAASARKGRVDRRLDDLRGAGGVDPFARRNPADLFGGSPTTVAVTEQLEHWVTRRTQEEKRKKTLQDRMAHAGFYRSSAVWVFTTGRLALFALPIAIGYLAARAGVVPLAQGVVFGFLVGLAGTLAPSFWLDYVKAQRQKQIRRALPDALDVLVVCLEGGLSLSGSFARVARELATAHPMLAVEFQIIERQTQMGRTTGEAVRELANRFDLEELRSMASVIIQAERIGSSVAGALEVFAATLREKRNQRAEEMAQKAAVKLLFPTVICIFPAIFVVILGPAVIQILRVMGNVVRDMY